MSLGNHALPCSKGGHHKWAAKKRWGFTRAVTYSTHVILQCTKCSAAFEQYYSQARPKASGTK